MLYFKIITLTLYHNIQADT